MTLRRYQNNPVLTAADLAYPASLVFNAGVARYRGQYVMVFRNDAGFAPDGHRDVHTDLGLALSDDGLRWRPLPTPWLDTAGMHPEIQRFYDPRLTVVEGRCYLCFAVDTAFGVCGGIGLLAEDLGSMEILSLSVSDNRNMVLFPEKVGGRFIRLERPFPEYSRGYQEQFDIWLSTSRDGREWGESRPVLATHDVPFANSKIGPAAPPVRTDRGFLTTFHAVWKDDADDLFCWEADCGVSWHKTYCAGLMLLDLQEPSKVIGLCRRPLLVPETPYELEGFRGSVIFPGGMILEDSGEVKIYYGAADTVECLATAGVDELLALCEPVEIDHFSLAGKTVRCRSPLA